MFFYSAWLRHTIAMTDEAPPTWRWVAFHWGCTLIACAGVWWLV